MPAPVDTVGDFTNAPALSTPVAAPYKADADLYDARFLSLFNALNKAVVGIDAASIQDGIITRALVETQPAWLTVALTGATWTPANLSYYKDSLGVVHLRPEGLSASVDFAAGAQFGTMPAGFRPGVKSYFAVNRIAAAAFGSCGISIDTNGVMKFEQNGLATAGVSLANVEYRAEN